MHRRAITYLILISFVISLILPLPKAAQAKNLLGLPEPGSMVNLSPSFEPMLIKGLKIHPENPFLFDFILDRGDENERHPEPPIKIFGGELRERSKGALRSFGLRPQDDKELKQQSSLLIKYFLTALTVPERDLWVNLSPYEKSRMIASNLGQTEMGRDMLAQDYILKQLTASLIYPEKNLGKSFWDHIYTKAREMYGTTQIPVNTFNKVWIVADKADVYEHDDTAYVVGAHLKVMLEEDYLAFNRHSEGAHSATEESQRALRSFANTQDDKVHIIASGIIRQIILPAIEKEVNTGKNFSSLRQMFYSMILASWYKMALKDALLTQVYGNQSKVRVGVNQADPKINQEIFNRYLQAYKKGVFNYIKEDSNQINQHPSTRKYFSGGTNFARLADTRFLNRIKDPAMIPDGDVLPSNGHLLDATVSLRVRSHPADWAMASTSPTFLKTVVWQSKDENGLGLVEISDLEKYKGKGTVLDPENREVWEQYSSTEVYLKDKIKIAWEDVKKITGDDADRVWGILKKAKKGIPEVRITRVWSLSPGPDEEDEILKGIRKKADIVLLNEDVVEMIRHSEGNVKIRLTKDKGIFPSRYDGKEVQLSKNVKEILTGFTAHASELPPSLNDEPQVAIKVSDVFRIKFHDRKEGRQVFVCFVL